MVKALLSSGANITECMSWEESEEKYGGYTKQWVWKGDSALMAAAKENHKHVVTYLLLNGATDKHQCCYTYDRYDESAHGAAKRVSHTELSNYIKKWPQSYFCEMFLLVSKRLGREYAAFLIPEVNSTILSFFFQETTS